MGKKRVIIGAAIAGLKSRGEIYDVSTTATVERYTGNFHGYQPWSAPKNRMRVMMQSLTRTLPGLGAFTWWAVRPRPTSACPRQP